MLLQAEMWAEAGHCYEAVCVTGILIVFQPSVVSPRCGETMGKSLSDL